MPESVSKLRHIGCAPVDKTIYLPESSHSFGVPSRRKAKEEINDFLQRIHLDGDAHGIWIGYPNLQQAVESLIDWVGVDWPSKADPKQPALFGAIACAISTVKDGLDRQESARRDVISNFHTGLTRLVKDIAGYCAWGCTTQKAVEQWEPFAQPFHIWCESGRFDKVLFTDVEKINQIDHDGLTWKMRSNIAPTYDIGVMHRHGSR